MKYLIALGTFIQCSLLSLPLGNPWEASLFCEGDGIFCAEAFDCPLFDNLCFSVRGGFYGDYVYNRHLEVNGAHRQGNIDNVQVFTNAALINVNFCQRIDFFATLGVTSIDVQTPERIFDPTATEDAPGVIQINRFLDIKTEDKLSWSVGGRGTIWRCGNFALGGESQYFETSPEIEKIVAGIADALYPTNGIQLWYREWQIGVGASYQACISKGFQAYPYAGLAWSRTYVHTKGATMIITDENEQISLSDWGNARLWTYVVGLTFVSCEKFNLGFEGRFASEKAFYFNSTVRF